MTSLIYHMSVRVYRNLGTKYRRKKVKVYSVMDSHGKVICHTSNLVLEHVKFVVWSSKRDRALSKRRRTVHAFACGKVIGRRPRLNRWEEVTYDPYLGPDFFIRRTGKTVQSADYALVTPKGVFIPATNDHGMSRRDGGEAHRRASGPPHAGPKSEET